MCEGPPLLPFTCKSPKLSTRPAELFHPIENMLGFANDGGKKS